MSESEDSLIFQEVYKILLVGKTNPTSADLESTDLGLGLQINEFTTLNLKEEKYFEGIFEIGFGWTPYPGGYMSRGTIISSHSVL